MNFESFLSDILATIAGGVLLAILFFWSREKLFPLPDITGRWFFQIRTRQSDYRPYDDMVLKYVTLLWREGARIEGTVEKYYEISSTGEREYVGKDRTRGRVEGYVEKKYFGKDRAYLHVVEEGHGRQSTNFYELLVESGLKMSGTFTSMVANQEGDTTWQREEF